jgi:hypothetical protein
VWDTGRTAGTNLDPSEARRGAAEGFRQHLFSRGWFADHPERFDSSGGLQAVSLFPFPEPSVRACHRQQLAMVTLLDQAAFLEH